MSSTICEICHFHPATRSVSIVEEGARRDVPVCDVHRRVVLADAARTWTPARAGETSASKSFA
jgi:hypothetical protein